ncbi:hypothetical protein [Chryseobacterium sp. ISL-6]|uniref:hypothetical protein n=1 Tax=Chryseobacterium sp. ISL-6 TaxID=2819143 RepID=UPI001BE8BBE8|nr:hypothetical protein [Chryseobacterium sp. ISL-6]MBT2621904.1 hypothetical protein [Chryseobacterium sp. ISL-6]
MNPLEKYEDLKSKESFFKERLSHLKFFIDYDEVTFENDLVGYTADDYEANDNEKFDYQIISNFNCFKKLIISADKFSTTVINVPFNLEGWEKYYQDLLSLKFPEFSDEIMIGNDVIRYRQFKDDYFLGIETNYKLFKNKFKKDYGVAPHHKLIIFKKLNKKKIERIVIFEKFVHPHFDPPAYSFGSYYYAKNLLRVSDIENSFHYFIEKDFMDDGSVELSMSEEFGEYLKRHVFFYYDMLSHTTRGYIKFIEESFDPENE